MRFILPKADVLSLEELDRLDLTFIEVMPIGDVGEGRLDQYLPLSMVRPRSKRIRNRRNLIFA